MFGAGYEGLTPAAFSVKVNCHQDMLVHDGLFSVRRSVALGWLNFGMQSQVTLIHLNSRAIEYS